jgi:FtsX extracellular domain
MDELGRALQGLAAEACAGVTGAEPRKVRRRGRRRVATHLAGGLAVGLIAVALAGQTVAHQLQDRPGGPLAAPRAEPTPGPAGREARGPALDLWTGPDVAVFLDPAVTDAQRHEIRARILAVDAVESVDHESKAEAFARFKAQFQGVPAVIEGVTEEALPESYGVTLSDLGRFAELEKALCPGKRADGAAPDGTRAGGQGDPGCMPGVDVVLDFTNHIGRALAGISWNGHADVAVILRLDVTPEQRTAIRSRLEAIDLVVGVEHETREQARTRFVREQREAAGLAPDPTGEGDPKGLEWLGAAEVPESFRVRLVDPDRYEDFREAFCATNRSTGCAPGVLFVVEQRLVRA